MTKITMQKGVPPTTPDVDAKVKAAEEVADAADTAQAAAQDAPGAAKPTEASKDAGAWAGRATGDPGANSRRDARREMEKQS